METELFVLFFSAGFLVIGVFLWQKGNHLLANGKKADAVIFKNNFHPSRSAGGTYHPVVRFLTDKQEWVTQELSIGYSKAKREGTKLQVIYDPEDPTVVEINSTLQLEILPRLFVTLGITGLVFVTLEALQIIALIP
jgi:hypothetical protein